MKTNPAGKAAMRTIPTEKTAGTTGGKMKFRIQGKGRGCLDVDRAKEC